MQAFFELYSIFIINPRIGGKSMRAKFDGTILFIFSAVALLCFCLPVSADGGGTEKVNSLEPGSWSLQFRITENFQLSSFQGATLSAKRHLSAGRAIRFGISLNGSVTDKEQTVIDQAADSTFFDLQTDENQQYIRFDAQYLFYPSPEKKLGMFFGAGPLFEFSRNEVSSSDQWAVNKIWSLGVSAVLGVEWFATERISFLSEYSSRVSYDIQISEKSFGSNSFKHKDEAQTLSFAYSSVKFGLSVYL